MLSYFVVILLSIALVGTVSFYISYKTMADRAESAGLQLVRQIENNMDNDFHSKRNLLLAPYNDQAYIDGINRYADMSDQEKFLFRQRIGDLYLKSFNVTPIRDFLRFQIYYGDGELLSSSDARKPWTPSQVRNSEWFRSTVAKDGEAFFSGFIPQEANEPSEVAAYASSIMIRDFSNPDRFIVVRTEYRSSLFRSIGQNDDLSLNSRIVILDEDNRLVYESGNESKSIAESELLERAVGREGKFWINVGGEEMLASFTSSGYSNWKAVLVTPRVEIFGALDKIKTTVIFTAIIAFVFTFMISVLFGQRITRPILNLYKTVNRIKRGDFSLRVKIDRNDEIGRIGMNFNAMQDELQTLIETKYLNQIKLQEVELAMLYSQINPHFLYNTLDSIRAMSDYYKVEEISVMAQSLADMFRYNTKNKDEIVTLQEELDQIDSYIKIQSIRFEGKIECGIQIDEALYGTPLLKMTLQPLVENAVFHGIERKRGKGMITISASKERSRIRLSIKDDGVGISEKRLAEIRDKLKPPAQQLIEPSAEREIGIGIVNVYSRYAIRFGDRFDFTIDSKKGSGTEITLVFPPFETESDAKSESST
ncbi:sensor histidine kinase [Cohnella faecalis]|uniref:histidine kinase n=1 Tax=Cohnella faecalis TaxID=2315694 RepID=A0A398CC73_9BACL|nr:sensor histidine kinase [Cohnella faecalis]RIE00373.1 sensor histidine kinase [Cohnella faecalis]